MILSDLDETFWLYAFMIPSQRWVILGIYHSEQASTYAATVIADSINEILKDKGYRIIVKQFPYNIPIAIDDDVMVTILHMIQDGLN